MSTANAFVIGLFALCGAAVLGFVDMRIGGGSLAAVGVAMALANVRRAMPPKPGAVTVQVDTPPGMTSAAIIIVMFSILGAAFGTGAARERAMQDAARQRLALAEGESKIRAAKALLTAAQSEFDSDAPVAAADSLEKASKQLEAARTSGVTDPSVDAALARLNVVRAERLAAKTIASAEQALAALKESDSKTIDALVAARSELSLAGHTQPVSDELARVDERIHTVFGPMSAIGRGRSIVMVKLANISSSSSLDGITLKQWPGTVGLIQFKGDNVAGGDLVAFPASGSIGEDAAKAFVEILAGIPKSPLALSSPKGTGPRTVTVTVNGALVRQSWFDGRMTELTVGSFTP